MRLTANHGGLSSSQLCRLPIKAFITLGIRILELRLYQQCLSDKIVLYYRSTCPTCICANSVCQHVREQCPTIIQNADTTNNKASHWTRSQTCSIYLLSSQSTIHIHFILSFPSRSSESTFSRCPKKLNFMSSLSRSLSLSH